MEELVWVVEARYVSDYVVWLRFNDGLAGEVDLGRELYGEVFEPLRDKARFAKVTLHPELGTIVWPNEADFAPEFLHEQVRRSARHVLKFAKSVAKLPRPGGRRASPARGRFRGGTRASTKKS